MTINLISDIAVENNFALQKVRAYHQAQGQEIISDLASIGQPGIQSYISVIFTKYRNRFAKYEGMPTTLLGGSGWDLSVQLPPEIDSVKPKVNFGFTSRGCNRLCGFCIVPQKEGRFHIVGDLLDLWDGTPGAELTLWDNNILFDHDHFDFICQQAREMGVSIDFNQGLDFRLLTERTIESLQGVKHHAKWRFALDDVASIPLFREKLPLIRQVGSTPFVYVYVDGTDPDGEIKRLDFLREEKCKPFLMKGESVRGIEKYSVMEDYCNGNNGHFFKMNFDIYYPIRQKWVKRTMKNDAYMRMIKIKDIRIGTGRRTLEDITELAKDIKDVGLISPISLTKDKFLIAGQHRLEACKSLGWEEIPAIVFDVSPEMAKIMEIDENIQRKELKQLERSEQLKERKRLYEIEFPGATKKAKALANKKGIGSAEISFAQDVAQKTGYSKRAVECGVQIAENLSQSIRDKIRPTALADNQSELLTLARSTPEEQETFVEMYLSGATNRISNAKSMLRRREKEALPEAYEPVEDEDFIFTANMQCGNYLDIVKSYPDASCQLALTDPPYNQGKGPWDRDFDPRPMMPELYRILDDKGSALIFCSDILLPTYLANTGGLKLRQIIHWHKTNPETSPLDGKHGIYRYLDSMEYILWFTKGDKFTFNVKKIDVDLCGSAKLNCFISGTCSGNERMAGEDGKALHPCQKPTDLIESLLLTHSNRGDRVVDLFVGSGTIAEVAVQWGRKFAGCEMDPDYFDFALKRTMFAVGGYPEALEEYNDYEEDDDLVREFDWTEELEVEYQADMTRLQAEREVPTSSND
jgi:ParB/RepB/Spo0J family partition protein